MFDTHTQNVSVCRNILAPVQVKDLTEADFLNSCEALTMTMADTVNNFTDKTATHNQPLILFHCIYIFCIEKWRELEIMVKWDMLYIGT